MLTVNLAKDQSRGVLNNRPPKRGGSGSSEPTRTLFVANLAHEMTDTDYTQMVRELDGVNDFRLALDRQTGAPRGYAHVDFASVEHATQAKNALASKTVKGRVLYVDFATNAPRR